MESEKPKRKLRPSNALVQFFQDALISCKRETDDDWDSRESFLREKAAERNVSAAEAATSKQIATFLARTPTALVEIQRTFAAEEESEMEVVGHHAFVVPAYGDFLDVACEQLEEAGYTMEHEAEGQTGEIRGMAFVHPDETVVTIRLYEMEPMAQGPHGLSEMVKIFVGALDEAGEEYLSHQAESHVEKRQALIDALRNQTPEMTERLEELKAIGERNLRRDDFFWHHLLTSFATMGNTRGYEGLIEDDTNYSEVTFDALSEVLDFKRTEHLERVLSRAKVRMPSVKARRLDKNFRMVKEMGGPLEAKQEALRQEGKEAKIAFMKRFIGIGPKYARNIWMDVYHPEFRDTIAIDERIKSITRLLEYEFESYEDHESFYQEIAEEAGLEAWEVDRLLYNFKEHFESAIKSAQ